MVEDEIIVEDEEEDELDEDLENIIDENEEPGYYPRGYRGFIAPVLEQTQRVSIPLEEELVDVPTTNNDNDSTDSELYASTQKNYANGGGGDNGTGYNESGSYSSGEGSPKMVGTVNPSLDSQSNKFTKFESPSMQKTENTSGYPGMISPDTKKYDSIDQRAKIDSGV